MSESLLDNALVLKYFGCEEGFYSGDTRQDRAYRVLQAMEQPINLGDKVIYCTGVLGGQPLEGMAREIWKEGDFHPHTLRLPSRFQTQGMKECDCPPCRNCGVVPLAHQPPPSEVEEKIEEIIKTPGYTTHTECGSNINTLESCDLVKALLELVQLARGK